MFARVHAVVLNYNSHQATVQAAAELAASRDVDVDVLVVDCASAATDREALRGAISADRLLLLPDNRGYAGGMNAGIEFWLSRAPNVPIILITPDARVAANTVRGLADVLAGDEKAGVVGPIVVNQESPRRISAGGVIDAKGNVRFLNEARSSDPYEVAWIDGCCMLLRPDAIRAVNGFDEEYFLYFEESDFCWRVHNAGWRVMVAPAVNVLHPKSRNTAPPHYYYYMARNGYRFRKRHFDVGTARTALDLARATVWLTSLAIASTVLPPYWHQARDRWRNSLRQWRGAWAGTRDHLKGRYGPQPR